MKGDTYEPTERPSQAVNLTEHLRATFVAEQRKQSVSKMQANFGYLLHFGSRIRKMQFFAKSHF
ncbi:MAG: hypothetical protein IJR88_02900 [Clostridia bacterium]|nr:hypothetical protein [Clostridia bacterium]